MKDVRTPKLRPHSSGSGLQFVEFRGERFYFGHGEDARQKHDQFKIAFNEGPDAALAFLKGTGRCNPDLEIVRLVDAYRTHLKGPDGSGRIPSMTDAALSFLCAVWGRTKAKEFSQRTLDGLLAARVRGDIRFPSDPSRKVWKSWSRTTANQALVTIRNVFRHAAKKELIPAGIYAALAPMEPYQKNKGWGREPVEVEPVPVEHFEAVLPFLPVQVAALLRVQFLTAARCGEVCRMTVRQIDRSGDVWTFEPTAHKTSWRGKDRKIFIGKNAQDVIRPFLTANPDAPIFRLKDHVEALREQRHARRVTPESCGNTPGTNRVPEPKREPGEFFSTATVRHVVERACKAAGIPTFAPNQVRHARATYIREKFDSLEDVAVSLGHAEVTTSAIYAKRKVDRAREIARQIG